jgi:hypothetical protein
MKLHFLALSILMACAVPCLAQTNCTITKYGLKYGKKLKLQSTYTVTYVDKELHQPALWKERENVVKDYEHNDYFLLTSIGGFMYDYSKPVIIANKIMGRQILNRVDDGNTVVITSREYTSRDYEGVIYIDSFVFTKEGWPLFESSRIQGLSKVHTTTYEYNADKQLISTKQVNPDGEVRRSVVYTYTTTATGNLEINAAIIAGASHLNTKEVFNKNGDLISTTNTHASYSGVGSGFAYYTYNYDDLGRWISREYHLGENGPVVERLERSFL